MQSLPHDPSPRPRVSCLMVTRGQVDMLSFALACYVAQDYPHRELLIVTDGVTAELTGLVARHAEHNVRISVSIISLIWTKPLLPPSADVNFW